MESKKLSKKLNTIFWFILYCLPLIVFFVMFIGCFRNYDFALPEGPTLINVFSSSFSAVVEFFSQFLWPLLTETFFRLFGLLGFPVDAELCIFLGTILVWFVQLYFVHIIIDVLLFIPRLFHNIMERWS